VPRGVPGRGNVSAATVHNVLRRLYAGHAPGLAVRELADKGILITAEEVSRKFEPARIRNDNYLEVQFQR
jgi:hypothetical protein